MESSKVRRRQAERQTESKQRQRQQKCTQRTSNTTLYEKYIKEKGWNKYGSELLPLPAPRLVVFYNGMAEQPEEKILKLSDAFQEGVPFDIEVTVRMINVNHGNNQQLLNACKPLAEYSWLVEQIRMNNRTKDEDGASSAIDQAITAMPDDFVIKPFLEAHKMEVKGMLLAEYNEAETMELFKKDGERKAKLEDVRNLMETLKMTAKQAMEALKIPISEQSRYMKML